MRDPVTDLRSIAFLLERANETSYRVRAFRGAAAALAELGADETARRAAAGTLRELPGLGEVTVRCVAESLADETPVYLRRLLATAGRDVDVDGHALRELLRGDCHTHSDWSDGGAPIEEMAATARDLGHEYMVLTDHSPRLTVANGLSPDRLRQQIAVVAALNERMAPFRILTGIEVDILDDGDLDQEPELLAQLDVVVASVHSGLRDPAPRMTRRMIAAISNPHVGILGHCTGRRLATESAERGPAPGGRRPRSDDSTGRRGRARPPSEFDARAVFEACAARGVAVEINSRVDRLDPPKRLLRLAVEAGCHFAIDTDAHAPGQLDWLAYGCVRAAACGVDPDTVINTWEADRLRDWTRRRSA